MTRTLKDGWHEICGYDVYVEDGKILRDTKNDINGGLVPAYPYTVAAFREGVRRRTVAMF